MSRPTDFSKDLADVSNTVDTDVDALIKLVRQRDAREGESSKTSSPTNKPIDGPVPDPPLPKKLPKHVAPKLAKRTSAKRKTVRKQSPTEKVILENVTTRLSRATNELLTEAALRQKLKKEDPATRQDIIEVALQDWFQRHGYSGTPPADVAQGE